MSIHPIRYFFLSFEEGLLVLEGAVLEGVVFFAEAGLDARWRLAAAGLALSAAVFFSAADFNAARAALGRGSVFNEADAETGWAAVWAGIPCLAASRQFG